MPLTAEQLAAFVVAPAGLAAQTVAGAAVLVGRAAGLIAGLAVAQPAVFAADLAK